MRKSIIYGSILLLGLSTPCFADNVILMMGDGMGYNHLKCANTDKPLYIYTLPVKGQVRTNSYKGKTTDSGASGTAYSCGIKTINGYLGKDPQGNNCTTIAEEAVQNNISVGIYSTDGEAGVTPATFYAHTTSRKDKVHILEHKANASLKMDIGVPVKSISKIIKEKLEKQTQTGKTFFVFFEGAKIDLMAHKADLARMKTELYDFDKAIMTAVDYVHLHPDTTLIVLADHESGGITDTCEFTTKWHTSKNIPIFAYGKHADLFQGEQENTDIYPKMKKILGLSLDGKKDANKDIVQSDNK